MDEQHKKTLEELRQRCKLELNDIDQNHPLEEIYICDEDEEKEAQLRKQRFERSERVCKLYQDIAEAIKQLIRQMVKECIQVLGKPPCDYAIVGLGSLAREEMTPYSDLEFAILIANEKEEYKQYFRNLTKLLHLKVINLGETILLSMAIPILNNYYSDDPSDSWFFDDVTPRGFAFDGAMPYACKTPLGRQARNDMKGFELIHTPDGMSKLQKEYEIEQGTHLSNDLTEFNLIIGSKKGSKKLVEMYVKKIQMNEKLFKDLAQRLLKQDIKEFAPELHDQVHEGKKITIKKDIYRLISIFIDRLNNLGNDHRRLGDETTAIEYFNKALFVENKFSGRQGDLSKAGFH